MRREMVLTAHLLTFTWTVSLSLGMAQKFVVPACDQNKFDSNVENCMSAFNKSMETSGYQDNCPWPTVKRIYNELKWCVDRWANASWCKGQRFLVDEVFLEVHRTYFSLCGQVHDPSLSTLIMLIAPSIIATLLLPLLCVHLTTWNTERPGSLGL
ncbi:receptor activity-modifying protein 1 [Stegastes partitus]|uniref:Receptor activity-modifying protein 1 n=1 Tax=Stegastes partitus TaxID=144197 RepID=A0A9Y4NNJ1_9TELE|nr:PREDICTED: receptor activity-modifying protein 1-like [Stegastes partitus]